jgi:hypothetical protein
VKSLVERFARFANFQPEIHLANHIREGCGAWKTLTFSCFSPLIESEWR